MLPAAGAQFNWILKTLLNIFIEFYSNVGHPAKLNKNIQQSFQYPIELSPTLNNFAAFLDQQKEVDHRRRPLHIYLGAQEGTRNRMAEVFGNFIYPGKLYYFELTNLV